MSSILRQEDIVRGSNSNEVRLLARSTHRVQVFGAQASLEQDVGNCPYALNERCDGAKDPNCLSGDFSYQGCVKYHSISRNDF